MRVRGLLQYFGLKNQRNQEQLLQDSRNHTRHQPRRQRRSQQATQGQRFAAKRSMTREVQAVAGVVRSIMDCGGRGEAH